jgi:flagellar basal-body rod protein FlgB
MNTDPTSLFSLAPKRLQWLATRQNVVSENIANSDVAGYRAQDVQLVEANSASGQFQMAASLYRKAHEMVYAVAGRK